MDVKPEAPTKLATIQAFRTRLMLKLKASRDRIKAKTEKCEGRKSYHLNFLT